MRRDNVTVTESKELTAAQTKPTNTLRRCNEPQELKPDTCTEIEFLKGEIQAEK